MIDWLQEQDTVLQAFIATCFTWFVTALGAACVFIFRGINRKFLDAMMGFAAGVMIAASFWSLLSPAIEMAEEDGGNIWAPAAIGFLAGGIFIFALDKIIPHLHLEFPEEEKEGISTNWHRSLLLVSAVTLHNIPEGLAIGVAFGALGSGMESATFSGALALAIGIGIQNFPEGVAVSMPLRREGFSKKKSFLYGQFSGLVEPVGGVLGAVAVMHIEPLLPYALSFAAGAMIFVVVEELIPESHIHGNADLATMGLLAGFVIMMILDLEFG